MPYYGDALPYYYGGPFSNHSSLMTGTGRTLHSPLGSTRYAPHLTTISESPLSALRRYSPAATMTTRPKRIIDTADIDVSTPRALSSSRTSNDQRNRLRRDRPTIRIRSQALKDNPALREHYERHEKTVGELLVEKFLIKDKKAKTEDELRTKLYSQVSLEDNLTKEQRNDLQEAIQRRITRRMTRRRSSADVQMDPEQIEREVLFAQAQADVLDTLVAEEQAEIEVEARMGTLIRKNLVRTAALTARSSREVQGTSTDDADDPITKKLPKKVKKRKKLTDKPSPPSESDFDSERDATRTKKVTKEERNEEINDKAPTIILGLDETIESLDGKTKVETPEETTPLSPSNALKFKIEASNSVGDFSTLWINASVSEEQEEPKKHSINLVEQYRDSVRLPAPKQIIDKTERNKKKEGVIEEHQEIVVIPVKKRYVKDDARNSVYLTLKTQKCTNSKKMPETNDNVDRIEAIDDIVDQSLLSSDPSSTMIKGKTIVEERSKNISSMADDTTSDIKRQERVNKVAKFRSKDITESDVEVKSISESSAVAKGKIGTKDVSLQNSSGINDDTRNAVARASISETSKLDKNEPSVLESTGKRSDDRTTKILTISNIDNTNLETTKTRDADDSLKININSDVPRNKTLSMKDVKIPVEDPGAPELRENGAGAESEKPLVKRAKKIKELQEKSIGSLIDEAKRLKRNVASSLDFSSIGVCAGNSQDRRNNGKEQQDVSETKPSTAGISSTITNLAESLPNASTVNVPDTVNGLTIEAKIKENSGIKGIENAEEILPGKPPAEENLSSFQEIEEKMTRGETLKPIGLLGKKTEVNNLIKDETLNIVEPPATIESPKILAPAKIDVNFTKNDNNDELMVESSKKLVTVQTTTTKDDNDSVEVSKLRNNRKVPSFSSKSDGLDVELSSPNSSDFQVVSDVEKNHTLRHKSSVIKVEEPSLPNVEKLIKGKTKNTTGFVTLTEQKKDSLDKRVESMSSEPLKLTNGISDKKPQTIVQTKNLATDSKNAPKFDVPRGQKEEEIDFWGEIANEEIPGGKLDPEIAISKEVTRDDCMGQPTKRDGLGDSMVTVLETKSEALPESGTGDKTERLDGEKKSNKVKKKKKKLIEDGGCKKKDKPEKVSAETIFERLKISDQVVHEESRQSAEGLEHRSKELSETSVLEELGGEKNCVDPTFDKFERNLSTIVEESSSPISEKVSKSVEAFDLIESSLINGEENSKLEITQNSSSFSGNSERREETSEKEIPGVVSSRPEKPEVPLSVTPVESEKPAFTDVVLPGRAKIELPSINIIVSPCVPSEDEIQPEVEHEVLEDDTEEDPGTPTNETIDDAANNIAKWPGHADLSLDEPDKDIGPEVVLCVPEIVCSDKKKTVDSKKTSKKSTNSTKSTGSNQDSSKKKKIGKKKKTSTKNVKVEPEKKISERSSSKVSNSSDVTLKPNGQNLIYSPMGSGCNSPKQRPLDLIKMFYTTPASLLTATPRDLSKVRRAKIKKRKHSSRTTSASSDSTGSTRSTQSTGTAESTASTEHEDDTCQKRISSTRSNDSGFDGSPRLSNCDMACHKKCEKLTGNLCGLNQKLVAEALQALKRAPSQSSDNQRNSDGSDHHASGRITPPATNLPRFKKYTVTDFNFLKVLGKGSFGKVLLAELRRTDCVYAVKCLKKDVVLEDDDVECTLIERKVLTLATRHPYLCHLFCTFQTDSHLFFVMEYLNGGDLMFHIQKSGRFAESRARFYAAEIWSGLNFLHKKGIVYRDLKLDNVLLDFEGHIRIADFGMCKLQIFLDRTADTFCGTPDYMAPEIIKGLKYNQAVDWWSFGVLLYEMLTGQSPFSGCDEDELFWSICNERPFIPRYLSQEAMDVLICLLEKDAGKRPPAHEISVHPFFHSLQWDRLERRQLEPPFKPALEHTLDTRYFDTAFTAERPRLTPVPEQILTSMDQGVFRGFSYTNPNATD